MGKSQIIKVNGIGPVFIEQSRRAKHIGISIKTNKGVRVAVPVGVSFGKAMEFVHSKKTWIKKHLATITHHETESRALAESSVIIDRAKAKILLIDRLNRLAEANGFTFNTVSIRNQKTRWGSCSHNNNISLNMRLMLLPEDLADYVIFHELVHTQIHNHSKSFWEELGKYVGNSKRFNSRLKKYGYSLL